MKNTIDMAREAELVYWLPNSTYTNGRWWMDAGEPGEELKAFEALVRADEREKCAKVCEARAEEEVGMAYEGIALDCAAAIRARANT
jgi:hypothetical protein